MRVALLTDRFPPDPGGLAVASARIARGLAAEGDEVDVHAVRSEGLPGVVREESRDGVRVLGLAAHRRAEDTAADAFDRLVARHRERPYDVLHGFYLVRSGFLAAYAGSYLGVPSLASARGNDLDRSVLDPAAAPFVLKALDLATCVTAVSHDLARKAGALCPSARVEVVPNGVDTRIFRPVGPDRELLRTLGLAGRAVLGFSGELRRKKGLTVLLPALAELARERPVTLLAAGGVRADDLGTVELFRRQHPEVHLVALSPRDPADLAPVYALMDVFVHPSLRDGLPNALLEAMACGRPVVGAAAGGIPDAVRDGTDGLLVDPGDVGALVVALRRVLDDRDLAARLGAAGRERVRRDFMPEVEVRRYRALHRELQAAASRASGGASARASS
jgi:glycosyltransferase involved in cell wall biosynthesis